MNEANHWKWMEEVFNQETNTKYANLGSHKKTNMRTTPSNILHDIWLMVGECACRRCEKCGQNVDSFLDGSGFSQFTHLPDNPHSTLHSSWHVVKTHKKNERKRIQILTKRQHYLQVLSRKWIENMWHCWSTLEHRRMCVTMVPQIEHDNSTKEKPEK